MFKLLKDGQILAVLPGMYDYWNGVEMSEEDYNISLIGVFDTNRAKPGYEYSQYYSYEEILALLEN